MKSKAAKKVQFLLKETFPTYKVYPEKSITYSNTILFFDFYLPELKLAIEVQGQQHYQFNKFFHDNPMDFKMQKYRDSLKTQWADEAAFKVLAMDEALCNSLDPLTFKKLVLDFI